MWASAARAARTAVLRASEYQASVPSAVRMRHSCSTASKSAVDPGWAAMACASGTVRSLAGPDPDQA